uniref:Hemagglutinin component HA-17 n=1 Tax=Clostridium botulinum TaxID=1491 RepID=A0A0A0UVT5_CLOBO|nr:hemagglutinin component HA-17 [Clostridium botulinum]AIW54574.1 hemagglutinin component HA-17 [Clostridium botulinum]AIW54635.1 hemagglutinin component HA-17 [Clostridium botulinum]AIW54690.1 hemagglutinin component HA-17 [Clostridium botulinum]AIW54754.1 hemagglutinin component HA-17 [Clostridium botulinum]
MNYMSVERTFLPDGNYNIKSIFSGSLYLNPVSGSLTFSSESSANNQKWNVEYMAKNRCFKISNVAEPNKYLSYDNFGFISLDSLSNKCYWFPIKIAVNTYIMLNLNKVNELDYAWDIYDTNENILSQPLLLLPNFDIYNSNQMLKLEKI